MPNSQISEPVRLKISTFEDFGPFFPRTLPSVLTRNEGKKSLIDERRIHTGEPIPLAVAMTCTRASASLPPVH
jgi:hypothetical protein